MSSIDDVSPILVYVYIYISYAALLISIPLSIFAFFIFTTQSKGLGVYNLVAGAIVSLLLGYMIVGVSLTLVQRYVLTVRPNWQSKFRKKYTLPAILGVYFTGFVCVLAFFIPILQLEETSIINWMKEDYPEFIPLFNAQKTFLYVSYDVYKLPILGPLFCLGFAFVGGISVTVYFVTQVLTLDSIPKNGLQYSLMATSVVQLVLICVFLLAPTIWFIASLAFQIQHSVNVLTFLLMVNSIKWDKRMERRTSSDYCNSKEASHRLKRCQIWIYFRLLELLDAFEDIMIAQTILVGAG
uniref:Serpentine receptor class gamma n=1 Tax=Panagrellus redivivus TaxID=6233 RepID=A0A7E5A0Z2_PANRE